MNESFKFIMVAGDESDRWQVLRLVNGHLAGCGTGTDRQAAMEDLGGQLRQEEAERAAFVFTEGPDVEGITKR